MQQNEMMDECNIPPWEPELVDKRRYWFRLPAWWYVATIIVAVVFIPLVTRNSLVWMVPYLTACYVLFSIRQRILRAQGYSLADMPHDTPARVARACIQVVLELTFLALVWMVLVWAASFTLREVFGLENDGPGPAIAIGIATGVTVLVAQAWRRRTSRVP